MTERSDGTSLVGAILAGGRSRRMGASKPGVLLRGRAMIEHPLAAFAEAEIPVVVVAKVDTPLPPLDVPIWRDADESFHPLSGIVTALRRAAGRPLIVCGCDMPFVTAELLRWLAGLPEPNVVPDVDGRLHPLLARYGPGALGPLATALAAETSMKAAVAALDPHVVDATQLARFGDPSRLVANVNTPAELADAEARF